MIPIIFTKIKMCKDCIYFEECQADNINKNSVFDEIWDTTPAKDCEYFQQNINRITDKI